MATRDARTKTPAANSRGAKRKRADSIQVGWVCCRCFFHFETPRHEGTVCNNDEHATWCNGMYGKCNDCWDVIDEGKMTGRVQSGAQTWEVYSDDEVGWVCKGCSFCYTVEEGDEEEKSCKDCGERHRSDYVYVIRVKVTENRPTGALR